MTTVTATIITIVELLAVAALAPIVPGSVQWLKAYLQGRIGQSPLQPYRELARLWKKSTFRPQTSSVIYVLVPSLVAACQVGALSVILPIGIAAPGLIGHDMLLLIGLLALGRFALALSAFDTSSGFGLMAVARDLMLSIWTEAALLLALLLAALPGGSTNLAVMSATTTGWAVWAAPAHWCAAAVFLLVIIAETGRQPVDNPDTHLELTMIHEGPLLEYSGRDLAYLQWAAAARHAMVFLMAATVFLPHTSGPSQGLVLLVWTVVVIAGLGITETLFAKMRLLRVPTLMLTGSLIALVGSISWFAAVGR